MEAKEAGDAAFKAGNHEKAVACYTQAIEAEPSNHLLYSNRSAAHAKLGQFTAALLDANKCIDLKPDWFRGHSRRGAAYQGLKNWRGALGAFEEGLKLEPNNEYMMQEAAALRKILEGRNAPSGSNQDMPPPYAPSMGIRNRFHGLLSVNVLVFTVLYILPVFRNPNMPFKIAVLSSMAMLVNTLLANFPISFSTLKDPALHQSQEMQAFLLCLMMVVSPPLPFAIMPFAATATLNICQCYVAEMRRLPGFLSRMLVPRAEFIISEEGSQSVCAFRAVSEVLVCLMSFFSAFVQGMRALILAFFYFRYVARRYASDFWTRKAVEALNERLSGLFYHRWSPRPIRMLYDQAKGAVASVAAKIQ